MENTKKVNGSLTNFLSSDISFHLILSTILHDYIWDDNLKRSVRADLCFLDCINPVTWASGDIIKSLKKI